MAKRLEGKNTIVTNEVRMTFLHLFEPYAGIPGNEPKYSGTFLLPKTDAETLGLFNQVIEEVKQQAVSSKWGGVMPPKLHIPIHDGDGVKESDGTPYPPECKGHWVFSASANSKFKPEVVNAQRVPITNQTEIYSGIYGQVAINIFAYSAPTKKGIGFGLGPVMKTRDGEPLSGGSMSAASAFGAPDTAATAVFGDAMPQPQPQYMQVPAVDPISGQPVA